MKKVLGHLSKLRLDEKTVKSITRLIQIWQERQIFNPEVQKELNKVWSIKEPKEPQEEPGTPPGTPPLPKKPRRGNNRLSIVIVLS